MGALNWNKAFALEQAAEDAELLQELVEIFKDSFKSDCALIQAGIASGDSQKVSGAAHSIKGASASLGIDGITLIAKEIETDARAGSLLAAQAQVGELVEMMIELNKL
jgi:histidine phosphotransfer protein HptB